MSSIKVPFFGKDRFYKNYSKEILKIVDSIYSHGMVLMGSEIEEFEIKIAKYCDRKYAVAVGSCTDALYFALLTAGIEKGDEVLVTGYSFIASASCILRIGAIPVFVDIEPDYYVMDLNDLERKITNKTKAIVAVSLFGQSLEIDKIEKIAKEHNLILIEDAAQALGSTYKDRKVGNMGLCSCISFDPTKILGAQGNGGIVLTDNKEIYDKVAKIRYHGKNLETGNFEILGFNSRLASLQGALLSFQLDLLGGWIDKHREIAGKYFRGLSDIKQIILPEIREGSTHIFYKFVIQVEKRDELKEWLKSNGIETQIHYDRAIPEYGLFNQFKYKAENLQTINKIKQVVLSLPIHPWLTDEEIDHIIEKIKGFFNNS